MKLLAQCSPGMPGPMARAVATALALTCGSCQAQEASASTPAHSAAPALRAWTLAQQWRLDGDSAEFAAHELAGQRVVRQAPFCADAVHETVQWLPDPQGGPANRIVQQHGSRLCRDGEGRVRQEVERGGQRRIYLHDPVAQESWALDPAARTARRLGFAEAARSRQLGAAVPPADAAPWREYGERMREWQLQLTERLRNLRGLSPGAPEALTPTPPLPPLPPMPPMPAMAPVPPATPVPGTTAGAGPAGPTVAAPAPVLVQAQAGEGPSGRVELRIVHLDPAGRDLPPLPPGLSQRASRLAPRGPGATTALPMREQDGLRLDGERTSWIIEAGRIGNERPIVITREVWRSPELLLVVSSREVDPRSGETSYRLMNLKRGEPDAALMKVPADFDRRGRPASPPRGAG